MQFRAVDERSQLEILVEEHNQCEALRQQLQVRERAIKEREATLERISKTLRARSDSLDKKRRFLDERLKEVYSRNQTPPPSSQPPVYLPSSNQPSRQLDFAYMQANLLNIPNSHNPVQIGGYGPLPGLGTLTAHEFQRRLYARGLHHGAQIGVWVSTIADHNAPDSAGSTTADFNPSDCAGSHVSKPYNIDKLNAPFVISVPRHGTHSQHVAGGATLEAVPVSRMPKGTLEIALANPKPYFNPRGPMVEALPPRGLSAGSVDLMSLTPKTVSPRSISLPGPPSRYPLQTPPPFPQHKQLLAVKGRLPKQRTRPGSHASNGMVGDHRGHMSSPERPRPSKLSQALVPRPRASPQPHLPGQLPAGLISELPPFRRAALAYETGSPTAPLSGPAVPAVELRNPALPPGRAGGDVPFHGAPRSGAVW